MGVKIYESIPAKKMMQFHEIIKSCGGRYLANPFQIGDSVSLAYEYGNVLDYNEHSKRWERTVTDIKETYKKPWWKKALDILKAAIQPINPTGWP